LKTAKFYVSTTRIENSYNAASEGIFLAEESYISDIGPHRELLQGEFWERAAAAEFGVPLLKVRRANLKGMNLKTWDTVVSEMLFRAHAALGQVREQMNGLVGASQ
jgi:hypothetical protein